LLAQLGPYHRAGECLAVMIYTRFSVVIGLSVLLGCGSPTAPGGNESGFVTNGSVRLAWYLDLPAGDPPFPAVVYGPGSGAITADNESTLRFARGLNDLGFAVMRYDKRGTGESTGEVPDLSTANSQTVIARLASDMRAVLDALIGDSRVDTNQLGLFGSSQANWYMPVVADEREAVDFMIVMTGGVIPTGMQNAFEVMTRLEGVDPVVAEERLGLLDDFEGELGFTQVPILERLPIPMFYLVGGVDPAYPHPANLAEMERLAEGGADLEFIVYPNGTHLLPNTDFWPDVSEWLDRKVR